MPNAFDQFDTATESNPFDQFDPSPQTGEAFRGQQISMPPNLTDVPSYAGESANPLAPIMPSSIMSDVVGPASAALINAVTPNRNQFRMQFGGDQATAPGLQMESVPRATAGVPMLNLQPESLIKPESTMGRFLTQSSTPEMIATLPLTLTGPGQALLRATRVGVPLGAVFAGSVAEALPGQITKAVQTGNREDIEDALTSAAMAAAMVHGATTKTGFKDASEIQKAAEIHGDVRTFQEPSGVVSEPGGGERIQPQAEEVAKGAQVSLTPAQELSEYIKKQEAFTPALESQKYLDAERKSIDAPIEVVDTRALPTDHPFSKDIATIDRESGKVLINGPNFSKWISQVPEPQRPQAVRSLLGEEQIHLGTTDAHAIDYWNTLTGLEKTINRRRYTGQWGAEVEESPTNMGHEALRFRIQQLSKMQPTEIAEAVGRNKWTVHSITALESAVRGVRESLGTKASKEALSILDRVQENLHYAKTVAGSQPGARLRDPDAEKIADEMGMRFDGTVMDRWMFTLFDKDGKEGTSIITKAGATPQEISAKYESKRAEYGTQENAPRPIKQAARGIEFGEGDTAPIPGSTRRVNITDQFVQKALPQLDSPKAWIAILDRVAKGDIPPTNAAEKLGLALRAEGKEAAMPKLRAAAQAYQAARRIANADLESPDLVKQDKAINILSGSIQVLSESVEAAVKGNKSDWYDNRSKHPGIEIDPWDQSLDAFDNIKKFRQENQPELSAVKPLDVQSGKPLTATEALARRLGSETPGARLRNVDSVKKELDNLDPGWRDKFGMSWDHLPERMKYLFSTLAQLDYEKLKKEPEYEYGIDDSPSRRHIIGNETPGARFRRKEPEAQGQLFAPVVGTSRLDKPGERVSATQAGAPELKVTPQIMEGEAQKHLSTTARPSFDDFVDSIQRNYTQKIGPGQLRDVWESAVWKRVVGASGEDLGKLRDELKLGRQLGDRKVMDAPKEPGAFDAPLTKAERKVQVAQQRYRANVMSRVAEKLITESFKNAKPLDRSEITPDDLGYGSRSKQPVYNEIGPDLLDVPNVLGRVLTMDAASDRTGARALPVSATKRVTALLDKRTGKINLVSTYYDGRRGAVLLDPANPSGEHIPIKSALLRYRPIASILLDEPVKNFHQKFDSMTDFNERLGSEARQRSQMDILEIPGEDPMLRGRKTLPVTEPTRQAYQMSALGIPGDELSIAEMETEGTPGLKGEGGGVTGPFAAEGRAALGVGKGALSQGAGLPITDAEAGALLDHILLESGKFHSPDDVKASLFALNENLKQRVITRRRHLRDVFAIEDSPDVQVVSAYRKLARQLDKRNPGLTTEELIDKLSKQLYENHAEAKSYEDFVKRTMAQGAARTRPTAGLAVPPESPTARELTARERLAPTVTRPGEVPEGSMPERQPPPPEELPPPKVPTEMAEPQAMREIAARTEEGKGPAYKYAKAPEGLQVWVPREGPGARLRGQKEKPLPADLGIPLWESTLDFPGMKGAPKRPSADDIFGMLMHFASRPSSEWGIPIGLRSRLLSFFNENKGTRLGRESLTENSIKELEKAAASIEDSISSSPKDQKQMLRGIMEDVLTDIRLRKDFLKSLSKYEEPGQSDLFDKTGPGARLRVAREKSQEEFKQAKINVGALMTRKETKNTIAGLRDGVDTLAGNAARQAGESVRLRSNDLRVLAAVKAKIAAKGNIDALPVFIKQINEGAKLAQQLMKTGDIIDRRIGRRWLDAANKLRAEVEYARAHWSDPALIEATLTAQKELRREYEHEINNGIKIRNIDDYVPGRYESDFFNDDTIMFGEQRVLGRDYRKPKQFANYYEAIQNGPYIPKNYNIADLVEHRVRQGQRQVNKRMWVEGLKDITDPQSGGKVAAEMIKTPDGELRKPSNEYESRMIGNRPIAIRVGYTSLIDALTTQSAVSQSPIGRAALTINGAAKHGVILILDTFHPMRLMQTTFSASPRGVGYRGGWSALEYRPEDLPRAIAQGHVAPENAAWAEKSVEVTMPNGRKTSMTHRQILEEAQRIGLNVGKLQDALYMDTVRNIPIIGSVNRWVFDRFTRGVMSEMAVRKFLEFNEKHPEIPADKLLRDVVKDTNAYYGSIGRQGFIRNPTARDLTQLAFLAPQWVEGLITKEMAFAGRATGVSNLLGRRGMPQMGLIGQGVGRGIAAYLILSQIVNLVTRHQFTWQNEEKDHKLDAFIPTGSGDGGVWLSPMSVFAEVSHDIMRLAETKPTVWEGIRQVAQNKLNNFGRFLMVLATRESPRGERLTSTASIFKTAANEAVPAPITLGIPLRAAGHAIAPNMISPPPEGALLRQTLASGAGIKTQVAESATKQISDKAKRFMEEQGFPAPSSIVVPTDEPSYSKLRSAIRADDPKTARAMFNELKKSRSDKQIFDDMLEWAKRPVTGSEGKEGLFLAHLNDAEMILYHKAQMERMEVYNKFLDFYMKEGQSK